MTPARFWRSVFGYVGAIYLGPGLAVLIIQVLVDEHARWQVLGMSLLALVAVVLWSSRMRVEIRQLEQERQEAMYRARESLEALEQLLDKY